MTETTTCDHCQTPTAGARLCERCNHTLAVCLANVAAYYDDLPTISAKQARYGSQIATRGSVGKEVPLPADGRFLEVRGTGTQVRYDTWATVVAWARVVMEDQPEIPGPTCHACLHLSCATIRRRRWPRNTIRSMVAYFDRQWRYLARCEWVAAFLDEMLDCENRMRRLIDRPADRWYAGKCSATLPEIGDLCPTELYAEAGKRSVTCRSCGAEHDVGKRRDFLLREAKDYLVTATEAAGALLSWTDYDGSETKLVDRIRKWRDRDQLEVADVTSLNGRDRHLYRLGDIQALLVESAQDTQRRRLETTP